MKNSTRKVFDALKAQGHDVLHGKGGFWLKGEGFVSLAKARRMTGTKAPKRETRPRISAYGDWATVAAMNRVKL